MEKIRIRGIVGTIICSVVFCVFIVLLLTQNLEYFFQEPKVVENIVELGQCKEGERIRLKFTRAYGTDYWYEENGNRLARFIDIEVNGKAFIALVEKTKAEEILKNENQEMYLDGIVKIFSEPDMIEGFEMIKQNYLEDFSEELTEEEILDLFTPMQFLSFGEERPNIVLISILFVGIFVSGICLLIAIVNTIKSVKSKQEKLRKQN